jgi:hypothetical protein
LRQCILVPVRLLLSIYEYKHYDAGSYKFTNNYYYEYTNTFSGSQVGSITVRSTQDRTAPGTTINTYDHRGRMTHSQIEEANWEGDKTGISHKYFAYNAENQIISSAKKAFGSTAVKTQNYYYLNGSSIADIGDKGTNTRPIKAQYAAGSVPGTYTVTGGESLTAIAQMLFGDGSLWYVIAEANALSMGPTDGFSANDVGRNLRIPNTSQTLKNNSTTFKPYNSGEVIGDLTPSPEILPPPKSIDALLSKGWIRQK